MVMATRRPSSPSGKLFAEQHKNASSVSLQDTTLLESPGDGNSELDETEEALTDMDKSESAHNGITEEGLEGMHGTKEAQDGMDEDTAEH